VQNANTCISIAGNGEERNRNNDYPKQASFAQPSGLCLLRNLQELFIADSESSTIRKMSLESGKVSAVVGGLKDPMNLFGYGDLDGEKYTARLQHPLGLTHHPSEHSVFVADTYNNKIKKITVQMNTINTMRIMDEENEEMIFNEPSDLCITPDASHLLVVNTNSHELIKVNLSTLNATKFNLKWPAQKIQNAQGFPSNIPVVIVPNGRIFKKGISSFSLSIALNLHEGVKLTQGTFKLFPIFLQITYKFLYSQTHRKRFKHFCIVDGG
jgi:DNA-binding beta-propeller fold protein YncE